ncbi:MAG: AAA family ATPase [Clostridium sp.]|nr:AAA family ATPase [Clostridium sp.]
MKPLQIKMTAFLGFKEETNIDFRPLYEDKIFLITGPTGSGKTSIFDAVAYALYGEGSGETRTKAKCFRSQLAGEKTNMEVELEFEVRGELYHVRRVETVKGLNKAYFYKVSDPETLWTKIREVNQEIETIVGLNLDQFKKIVMIPQGEFREFLTAGTKDKSDILKKLFSTEQYEVFQRKIKESFDVVVGVDKNLVRRFYQIIEDVGLEGQDIEQGPDALLETLGKEEEMVQILKKEEIFELKNVKSLEIKLEDAKNNNIELAKYEKVRDEYQALEEKKPEIDEKSTTLNLLRKVSKVASFERQLIRKEKEVKENKAELNLLEQDKSKLTLQANEAKMMLETAKENGKTLDSKKERRSELIKWMEKSKRINELDEELSISINKGNVLDQELIHLKTMRHEFENSRTEEQVMVTLNHKVAQEKSNLMMDCSKLENTLKIYRMLYDKVAKKEKLEQKISELIKQGDVFQFSKQEAVNKLKLEREKRNENYALLLRDELKDQEPCPVCGSLDHPLQIKLSAHEESDNLNRLEVQVKDEENKVQDNLIQVRYEQQGLEELKSEILTLIEENEIPLMDSAELKEVGIREKEEYEKLRISLMDKQNDWDARQNSITKINKIIQKLTEALKGEETLLLEKIKIDGSINELKGELRSLENEGVPKDFINIKNEISNLVEEINTIETALKKAIDNSDFVERKIENLSGRETALNKALIQALEMAKQFEEEFYNGLEAENLKKDMYLHHRNEIDRIEDLDEETIRFNQVYYEKKGIFESLKEEGEMRIMQELEPISETLKEAFDALKEKQRQMNDKSILVFNLNKAHERLGETYIEYLENKKELAVLQSLYDTANLGMGFETFVQSYYFEGILIRANERLKKMSEGRYQLRRRNETENRREKIGLGLNVFDEYSGRERDVLSLSGGESFKASLSLALGLSDFIESHKGSVNLGTIFIDEGFGSLDQDSLDNALECLLELNLSGRIVGIISHVTELKDRIPGRIEVTSKPGQGSKIVVNGGIK